MRERQATATSAAALHAAAMLLLMCGCLPDQPARPAAGQAPSEAGQVPEELYIVTPTAWWLRIARDGSAEYGQGADRKISARIAAGAFDLPAILAQLEPSLRSVGDMRHDFAVVLRRAADASVSSRYTSDARAIEHLFEQARQRRISPAARLDELWRRQPPLLHDPEPTGFESIRRP